MSTNTVRIIVVIAIIAISIGLTAVIALSLSMNKYAQNTNPDYKSFAYSYGNAVGASALEIEVTMPLSQNLGDTICTKLREGVSEEEMTNRLAGSGSGAYVLDRLEAANLVNAAHKYICSGE
jgi:hypothetical protein